MRWSFGIITAGGESDRIKKIVQKIRCQTWNCNTDKYEIIIIGGYKPDFLGGRPASESIIVHLPFKEGEKAGWITKKKNMIGRAAQFQNICIMHDYVAPSGYWLDGFKRFGSDWLTCMTKIENKDGGRFRDWCAIHNDAWMKPPIDDQQPPEGLGRLLDYKDNTAGRWQYYSGAYFCVKKTVLQEVPLDNNRVWGQGEDVQWSRLLYKQYGQQAFTMNPHSYVRFLKQKERAPWEK
jgi:hypothetical protein